MIDYIEIESSALYLEALDETEDYCGYLLLHRLLQNGSSIENALTTIEQYPAALRHQSFKRSLPLHLECCGDCRSSVISKCIELFPESLAVVDESGYMPLHCLMENDSSTIILIDDALMMIEKYPAALERKGSNRFRPIHVESYRFRLPIMHRTMPCIIK
jgi:hypothetical protein